MTLLEQCRIWHARDQHQKIFDAIEALPPEQHTAAIDMELARACNNLADPQTAEGKALLRRAISLLNAHRKELADTYSWNFRMGYACYYLDQEGPALAYFTRAMELHPGDSPEVNTIAELQDLIHDCRSRLAMPQFQETFRERAAAVWAAFARQEADIRYLLKDRQETSMAQALALCNQLFSPVLDEGSLALGPGDTKDQLLFPLEGSRTQLFAMEYLRRQAPEELLSYWDIQVGRQSSPGLAVQAGGQTISPAEVQVQVERLGDSLDQSVGLTLYCESLLSLLQEEEEQARYILSVLTDHMLGEVAAIRLIGAFRTSDIPLGQEAIPLSQLPAALQEMGLDLSSDPRTCIDLYSTYHLEPDIDPDADWRMDVITGSTNCPPLLMGYLEENDQELDDYHRYGIAAGFFCWPLQAARGEDRTERFFAVKGELEKALFQYASDAFTLMGDAVGTYYGYLDFIAWDLPAVLDAAKAFFETTGLKWANFHTFRRNVSTVRLFTLDRASALDPKTGSLLHQKDIDNLETCCQGSSGYFYKMLDYLEDFIEDGIRSGRFTERQAHQDLQIALWYAYACNNIGEYRYYYQSAQWMPDSEQNAAGCGPWYYRYSCALTYCGRLEEARRYAEEGIRQQPSYPWIWLQAAKLRAYFKDKAGALEAVRQGLALAPGDYEFLTLKDEIKAGASLEQMEFHWIDPDSDALLQNGQDKEADEKLRSIACITTNPKGLAQFRTIFRPDPGDYEKDAPFCSFHYPVKGRSVEVIFQMNEAALSKLDPAWLRTQKQRLDSGRWLTRQASLDQTGILYAVLFGLGHQVSLIYKTNRGDTPYFQVWLDNDGNLTARPGREDGPSPNPEAASSPIGYTPEEMQAVEAYISKQFGPFEDIIHELDSDDLHLDICMVPPAGVRNHWTLVTMGMGAYRMKLPRELAGYNLDRAELVIALPSDWKMGMEAFQQEQWYWPVRLLKSLARLPVTDGTWLAWGHTTNNQQPFAPGTDLCAAILVNPPQVEDALCILPGGEEVNFYQVIPLYRDELNYKLAHDAEALLSRMEQVSFVVNPTRPDAMTAQPLPYTRTIVDDAGWHLENIREKHLAVDDLAAFQHQAIYLRWCIEHDLMDSLFCEDYANFLQRFREDPVHTDLRPFIRDKLAGQILLDFFTPEGAAFTAFYYGKTEPSFSQDIDQHALDYFGPERCASEEFQDEPYLFVPFDEDYYQSMARVIQARWENWKRSTASQP